MHFDLYLAGGIGGSLLYCLFFVRWLWCHICKGRSKVAWGIQLGVGVVFSFIMPVPMGRYYPEDSACYVWVWVINIVTYVAMFGATSWASPKIWDYLPWE